MAAELVPGKKQPQGPGVNVLPTFNELPPPGFKEVREKELEETSKTTGIPVVEIQRLEDMAENGGL